MKFSMNGALTIGTLDGANIEIRDEVGAENFFLFGLSARKCMRSRPRLPPMDYYNANQGLRDVIDLIRSGFFSRGDTELFRPLIDGLMYHDPYMLFADFQSYVECQEKVVRQAYRDTERWTRMSILNTARSGKFSSDRTIREYCATSGTSNPCRSIYSHMRKQESHSPAQRLRRAPEQLIADGEGRQILAAHGELAQATDGDGQLTAHRGRRQLADDGRLALVRHHPHPGIAAGDQCLDLGSGRSRFSLMVSACEWQRMALTRTQMPSTGTGLAPPSP
jgi:hypothetical protein